MGFISKKIDQEMRKGLLIGILYIISYGCIAQANCEIIKVKLRDGNSIEGRLCVPKQEKQIKVLVVFVHGTGPSTYLDKRKIGGKEINYFDLFSDEITKRGAAFFSYNRRGCYISNTPPKYDSIVRSEYEKYLPETEVNDITDMILTLRKRNDLKAPKIVLLGWSEGTIIAPIVALKNEVKIDALLLAGYAHENMIDLIKWQNSGESAIINFRKYFDKDSNKVINRTEYFSDEEKPKKFREKALGGTEFSVFDANKDSILSVEDFAILNMPRKDKILEAFETNNDEWIWDNYFRVTTGWFHAHNKLEPNKVRMMKLNIPVFVFHGTEDANTAIEGALDIERSFKENNKANLTCYYFKGHNHDLNYTDWPLKGEISPGFKKIFETIEMLKIKL